MNALAVVPRETIADVVIRQIPVDKVEIGANVRVDPGELEGLAASIRDLGVLQPVKAVEQADGTYRLVWGQRRLLASRQAGLATIPAIIVSAGDVDAPGSRRSIEQLVENLDRRDLNPIEEAHALREVLDADPKLTQAALAEQLGRSPSWLANSLRLLQLEEGVQEKVRAGEISASHGKAIAALPAKQQRELAGRIVAEKMPAHKVEQELEWKRQAAAQDEAKQRKTEKWIPKAIAALEAADVAKDVDVAVSGGAWDMELPDVIKAIQAAGWTKVGSGYSYGSRPENCDCKAVRIEVGGRKAEVTPRCIDRRHADRHVNNDHVAREAERTERARLAGALRAAVRDALESNPPLREVVLLIVRASDGYGARPWVEYVGRPDAELLDALAEELTEERALFWPDESPVPVEELIASLVGPVADTPAEPAPKKSRQQARQERINAEVVAGIEATVAPMCTCGKPKVQAGADRWVCTNPDHKPSEQ